MADECSEFCKAMADVTRQRILEMLARDGEMCVCYIVEAFDVSQPTISHHLKVLRQAGLVTGRKSGREVYYSIDRDRFDECCGQLVTRFEVEDEREE